MKAWKAWIARDWSGVVYLYPLKPQKKRLRWDSVSQAYQFIDDRLLPPDINPQWSDEKPIEVNVNITKASDDVVTISKDRYEQLLQYEQEYISRQSMINSFMQNK